MRPMRSMLVAVAVAGAVAVMPAAGAQRGYSWLSLEDPSETAVVAERTGFTSDNVEWVDVLPQHTGSSGGMKVGNHYYMTDPRGVYIYDVSKPATPELVGELTALQLGASALLAQEEPETNGEILLVNAVAQGAGPGSSTLLIVDVSKKDDPKVAGSLALSDHTWSCFLDCRYAIGRTGHILDLTDPKKPEKIADWREHVGGADYMHDFIEVAPGRLIGSGQPSFYLDVTDPRKPRELARFSPEFHSLGYHGAAWPNGAKDPLLVMGAEVAPQGGTSAAGSDCAQESVHAVATYDARDVVKADKKQFGPAGRKLSDADIRKLRAKSQFSKLQEWRVAGRGVYADGNAPAHTLYCGHWFDTHPKWKAGGTLALAHYDWGTRFLDVGRDGKMKEVGYFQPVAGHTSSAKWISNDIVYVHDYRRGLDILRFKK